MTLKLHIINDEASTKHQHAEVMLFNGDGSTEVHTIKPGENVSLHLQIYDRIEIKEKIEKTEVRNDLPD